ncbi:MAG: 1-acyl-sn-glycerol-3-phosphate acyltransferase [Proteobacteria bacterium]|nr:1-acyl-sn-glycerol-3-phosphate acyltransferase [Pseudomonadota bacterium]
MSEPARPRSARGPVRQFLGSLFFTAFVPAWTFLFAIPFVVMCAFLPFRKRYLLARWYARSMLWVLKVSCGLTYRVEGAPIPAGAHVALWKHSSSWETMAMMVVFPRQVWVLKRELMWLPVVGTGIWQMHSIAINRKAGHSAVYQVVEQGKRRLAEGSWVMIYPEGTRMPVGATRRYGVSGTLLAQETGCLIVPVAHDAGYYWPRRGILKKPGVVRVVIGAPVSAAGRDVRELNAEIQAWVERTVAEIAPQG